MRVLIEALDTLLERVSPAARRSYLPASQRDQAPQVPDGTNLEIWSWEDERGKPHAICFWGKSNKPLWFHRFSNEQQRQKKIDATIERSRSHVKSKEEGRKERLAYKHTLKVGDILYASWGYDQTNIDFYEVIELKGKSVVIRQVASRTTKSEGHADYVAAVPGKYTGKPIKKLPQKGDRVKISQGRGSAYKWDGKPKYRTAFGFGH